MKPLEVLRQHAPETAALLDRVKAAIAEVVPGAQIVLYGSRARGDALAESDYDLLVLVDQRPTLELEAAIRDRLYPIELDSGAVLSLLLEERDRWRSPLYRAMPLVQSVERDGVVL